MNQLDKDNNELLDQEPAGEATPETQDELTQARAEAAEWRDKYVRQLAEFDNFRKRTRAEIENIRESVVENVLLGLLTVYDDMNRMFETPAADENGSRRGMELIKQKFTSYLESKGIVRLECRGKEFNPEEHDAILTQARAGFPAGVVLEELSPGYKLGDRVIRHAQVIVSAEAEESGSQKEGKEG